MQAYLKRLWAAVTLFTEESTPLLFEQIMKGSFEYISPNSKANAHGPVHAQGPVHSERLPLRTAGLPQGQSRANKCGPYSVGLCCSIACMGVGGRCLMRVPRYKGPPRRHCIPFRG